MKTKLLSLFTILLLIFGSCQNAVNKDSSSIKDNYSIEIEGLFQKNDKIEIYYLVEGKDWNNDNSVSQAIYASNKMQKIVLDLPKDVNPKNFRIDLGVNPSQGYVTIKNISIKYKDKILDGSNENFIDWFTPNEFVSWDMNYYGFKLSSVNGSYDPYLMGTDLLIDKIAVEFK